MGGKYKKITGRTNKKVPEDFFMKWTAKRVGWLASHSFGTCSRSCS